MTAPATLVLLWHMHQPDYRDHASGEFGLPWVYLHALKSYADMAAHLENHPGVRAVVNFTPILLEQLEDYAGQLQSGMLRDPLLRLLARPADEPPADADGLVWQHLRWTGETVRRSSPVIAQLMAKRSGYSHADRLALLGVVRDVVGSIVARYAKLAAAGRVELSTTPYTHPIAPLLISFESAREATPGIALPTSGAYPGGEARAAAQLDEALAAHRRRFNQAPAGIWPAEAAISAPFLKLAAARGISWVASSGNVLEKSAARASSHRAYRFEAGDRSVMLFFRDDRLSDLIGFHYARWKGEDAATHLVGELEAIAAAEPGALVSIILDGENPWPSYADNGYAFLDALYKALESHPRIRTATFRDRAQAGAAAVPALERIVAGSWQDGELTRWIGSPAKNQAWDELCSAKRVYDAALSAGRLDASRAAAAARQLAACEASDTFWWLGSDNPPAEIAQIERLFHAHLGNLQRLLS